MHTAYMTNRPVGRPSEHRAEIEAWLLDPNNATRPMTECANQYGVHKSTIMRHYRRLVIEGRLEVRADTAPEVPPTPPTLRAEPERPITIRQATQLPLSRPRPNGDSTTKRTQSDIAQEIIDRVLSGEATELTPEQMRLVAHEAVKVGTLEQKLKAMGEIRELNKQLSVDDAQDAPLTDEEWTDELVMLLEASGKTLATAAWERAFDPTLTIPERYLSERARQEALKRQQEEEQDAARQPAA